MDELREIHHVMDTARKLLADAALEIELDIETMGMGIISAADVKERMYQYLDKVFPKEL